MKKYKLKNTNTNEFVYWTLVYILKEINRDRSDEWIPYNKTDWREGLEVFTEWELIKK